MAVVVRDRTAIFVEEFYFNFARDFIEEVGRLEVSEVEAVKEVSK